MPSTTVFKYYANLSKFNKINAITMLIQVAKKTELIEINLTIETKVGFEFLVESP